MPDSVLNNLIQFTLDRVVTATELIHRGTRLWEDLKLTGDDAIDYLLEYSIRFNVDMSQFQASDYFEGEGMSLLLGNGLEKKVLTLGDLEQGIVNGKLG